MGFPNSEYARESFRRRLSRPRTAWIAVTLAYAFLVYLLGASFGFGYPILFLVGPIAFPVIRAISPLGETSLRIQSPTGEFEYLYRIVYEADGEPRSKWGAITKTAGTVLLIPVVVIAEVTELPNFLVALGGIGFALLLFGKLSGNPKIGFLWFTEDTIEIANRQGKIVMRVDRGDIRVHEFNSTSESETATEVEFSLPSRDGKGPYRIRVAKPEAGNFRYDLGTNRSEMKIAS